MEGQAAGSGPREGWGLGELGLGGEFREAGKPTAGFPG